MIRSEAVRSSDQRPPLACPVCKARKLTFHCRVADVELYGCERCGATLSVPVKPR